MQRLNEFALFNEQLATMLRDGLPLEASMRELSATMRKGKLRNQLQAMEQDLSAGVSLTEAARRHRLPELYIQMLAVGESSERLPQLLTQIAAYYQRAHLLGMRLRGLMTYPTLLIAFLAVFSVGYLIFIWPILATEISGILEQDLSQFQRTAQWFTPALMVVAAGVWALICTCPSLRRWLSWRISPFREAHYARFAEMSAALLTSGMDLPETLRLMRELQAKTPLREDLDAMLQASDGGIGKLSELVTTTRKMPPVMRWLLTIHEEDPATGFQRAADFYTNRSDVRAEILLYVAMPISVVLIAILVMLQFNLLWSPLIRLIDNLGGI